TVTQSASITVSNLAVQSVGAVTLTTAGNDVGTLAANVSGAGNAFSYTDSNALTIGTVDGVTGITTNGAAITVTSGGALTVGQNVAAGSGVVTLTAGANSLLTNNAAISGTGVSVIADRMALSGGTIASGAQATILRQVTNGRLIDLGSTTDVAANTLELSNAELNAITSTFRITVGDANSGNITITAPLNLVTTGYIYLNSGGSISQNSG